MVEAEVGRHLTQLEMLQLGDRGRGKGWVVRKIERLETEVGK